MRKLTLYMFDVELLTAGKKEKHILYIAARNLTHACNKAQRRLNEGPHGILPVRWKLTGHYEALGKVFI